MEYSKTLQRLRKNAGLTQEGLARASNLSASAVSKLEQGGIDPSWTTIQALASALGVNCEEFIESKSALPAKKTRLKKK
jgi:transcriptional regulator with XRE-family HTH domain